MATVTLYRRDADDDSFDAGAEVTYALATGGLAKSTEEGFSARRRTWHLWASLAGDEPRARDVIEDANGDRWVVAEVRVLTLGTRYRCETVREVP